MPHLAPAPLLEEEVEELCILGWIKLTKQRRPLFQLPSLGVLGISRPYGK